MGTRIFLSQFPLSECKFQSIHIGDTPSKIAPSSFCVMLNSLAELCGELWNWRARSVAAFDIATLPDSTESTCTKNDGSCASDSRPSRPAISDRPMENQSDIGRTV